MSRCTATGCYRQPDTPKALHCKRCRQGLRRIRKLARNAILRHIYWCHRVLKEEDYE